MSISHPTRTDLGSKPGLSGERPATNRLSQGVVLDTQFKLFGVGGGFPQKRTEQRAPNLLGNITNMYSSHDC